MARASSRPEPAAPLAPAEIAAAAADLGIALAPSQADALGRYAALLVRWSRVHNLTAIRSPVDILSHHLLDSLAILPHLWTIFGEKMVNVADVGSGGGLPGIPLAIAEPTWRVALIDKVAKKVAFLTQAKLELALNNVQCVHARVESLTLPPRELVVARAFSSLSELVAATRHFLVSGGWWAAMKGARPEAELAELRAAQPDVRIVDAVKLTVPRLGAERHLILLQRP